VVRYYPGVTFRQGPAPVRGDAAAPLPPPSFEAPALGVGLEGRSPAGHGWQLLANYSASPLTPAADPRLVLHGFWLPHHRWGLDADVGLDARGTLGAELGTSLLFGPGPWPDHRLRLAAGRQAGAAQPGYGWAQASLARDLPAWGTTTGLTLFAGQDGAALGSLDAWHAWTPLADLRLASSASLGLADPRLPPGRQMGLGLVSAGGTTATRRVACRTEVATPLARRLGWGWREAARLDQVEGALFLEGAAGGGTSDARDGARAGVGAEVTVTADTALGLPVTLGVGVACGLDGMPRVYLATSGARFGR
jgi:hypothetical protein